MSRGRRFAFRSAASFHGGLTINNPVEAITDQFTIRGDYHVTATNTAFMRWSWFRTSSIDNLNNADAIFPGQPQGTQAGHRWGYAIGDNWTLTPTLINEFTIGHQSATTAFLRPGRPAGLAITTNLPTDIFNTAFTQGRNSPVLDISDNLTKVRGNHTFKAGANIRSTLQYGYNYAGSGGGATNTGVYPTASLAPGTGIPSRPPLARRILRPRSVASSTNFTTTRWAVLTE